MNHNLFQSLQRFLILRYFQNSLFFRSNTSVDICESCYQIAEQTATDQSASTLTSKKVV